MRGTSRIVGGHPSSISFTCRKVLVSKIFAKLREKTFNVNTTILNSLYGYCHRDSHIHDDLVLSKRFPNCLLSNSKVPVSEWPSWGRHRDATSTKNIKVFPPPVPPPRSHPSVSQCCKDFSGVNKKQTNYFSHVFWKSMKSKKNKSSEVKRWRGIPLCTIKQSHEFKTAKRESGENEMRLLDFWNKHLNPWNKNVLNHFDVY